MVNIRKVAEDLIKMKLTDKMTLKQCMNKFYSVMRKYGIKQGIKTKNGRLTNSYEWTLCKELFISQLGSYVNWKDIICEVPKDLRE